MKHKNFKSFKPWRSIMPAMFLCAAPLWGLDFTWDGGGGTNTEWATVANWNPETVPGTSQVDVGLLGSSFAKATVTSDLGPPSQFVVRMRNGATLEVSANFGLARQFEIGNTGGAGATKVTQTAGLLRARDGFVIGQATAGNNGEYSISGGISRITLAATGATVNNSGTFSVIGTTANIDFDSTTGTFFKMNNAATLSYTLGASGVSPVNLSGLFTIDVISKLKVDASSYTGGAGTVNLFTYGSRTGSFDPLNITISGLGAGLSGSITYDADSMDLVITAASAGPALSAFSYNRGNGSCEVTITGAAGARYKLVEADDLNFSNPDQNPVPLTGVTVGSQDVNEVVADVNGIATVQCNLGTSKTATFIRAETIPIPIP